MTITNICVVKDPVSSFNIANEAARGLTHKKVFSKCKLLNTQAHILHG